MRLMAGRCRGDDLGMPALVSQPCPACGLPTVTIRPAGEQATRMDWATPIYIRERDGEGGYVWVRWPKGDDLLTMHRCTSSA